MWTPFIAISHLSAPNPISLKHSNTNELYALPVFSTITEVSLSHLKTTRIPHHFFPQTFASITTVSSSNALIPRFSFLISSGNSAWIYSLWVSKQTRQPLNQESATNTSSGKYNLSFGIMDNPLLCRWNVLHHSKSFFIAPGTYNFPALGSPLRYSSRGDMNNCHGLTHMAMRLSFTIKFWTSFLFTSHLSSHSVSKPMYSDTRSWGTSIVRSSASKQMPKKFILVHSVCMPFSSHIS